MKNLKLALIALLAMGSFGYAGGDISPITIYEIEDYVEAEEVYDDYVEPVIEEPVYVEPKDEPIIKPRKIATNGFYAGLGITGVKYKDSCKCKSGTTKYNDRTTGIVARVGYDFNEYIGIEARGLKTNWNSDGSKVKHGGLYIKPMLPITDSSNIYGLVGVAKTKVSGTLPNVDSEGLAMGVGVEVDMSQDTPKDGKYSREFNGRGDQERGIGIFVDYEKMLTKSDAPTLDAVSAGVTYDF